MAESWEQKSARQRAEITDLRAQLRSARAEASSATKSRDAERASADGARSELSAVRRQVSEIVSGVVDERVLDRIVVAVKDRKPSFEPIKFKPAKPGDRTAQELVLLLSDTHASEVVSLEETRGINEYNWSIMLDRMADISRATLSHAQHYNFRISKLRIFLLGDMLSGDIHEELAITNDRPTAEAVVDFAYDLVAWSRNLADQLVKVGVAAPFPGEPLVVLEGVPGNHPRATKKPSAKMAHNNGDWLTYKIAEALLLDDPLFRCQFQRGAYAVTSICDRFRGLLMHGDGIRTTMPGVPWGGVIRRITTLEAQFVNARQPLDYIFMGHFHTRNALEGVASQTWINGSVKGVDEYSLKQFGHGQSPRQTLLTFHPSRGFTGSYACDLTPKIPASEGW